jgi:hypothetical protein
MEKVTLMHITRDRSRKGNLKIANPSCRKIRVTKI